MSPNLFRSGRFWREIQCSPWVDPPTSKKEFLWRIPDDRWGWHAHWPKLQLSMGDRIHSCFGEMAMFPAPGGKYWLRFTVHAFVEEKPHKAKLQAASFSGMAMSPLEIRQLLEHWGCWKSVAFGGGWHDNHSTRSSLKKAPFKADPLGIKMGFVYFIQDGVNGGNIKIGFSANPQRRMVSLQAANPFTLKCLGTLPGTERMERELHKRFAFARRHGEFFAPLDAVMEFIEKLPKNVWWKPKPVKWRGP